MSWLWEFLAKYLPGFLKSVFSRRFPLEAFKDSGRFRDISDDLVHRNGHLAIDFCFLIQVTNGGNRIQPHSLMYWSIIDGSHNPVLIKHFEKDDYINRIADIEFKSLFEHISEKKEFDIVCQEMPKGSMRAMYEFEGIKFAKHFLIKETKKAMWYIMVGTNQSPERFKSVEHKHKFSVVVSEIKNMIRKY